LARKRNREKDFLFTVPSGPVDTILQRMRNAVHEEKFKISVAGASRSRAQSANLEQFIS
jgi:hypothetical protein